MTEHQSETPRTDAAYNECCGRSDHAVISHMMTHGRILEKQLTTLTARLAEVERERDNYENELSQVSASAQAMYDDNKIALARVSALERENAEMRRALEDAADSLGYFANSQFWKHEHAHSLELALAALSPQPETK